MIVPTEKPGTPEELVHFGVKGMRWGVRKAEETSGESGKTDTRSFSERHRKALIAAGVVVAVLAAYGAYKLVGSDKGRDLMNNGREFVKNRRSGWKETLPPSTPRPKNVINVKPVESKLRVERANKVRELATRPWETWKENSRLSSKMDVDGIVQNVVKPINPGYGEPGTKVNCRRCTFAYELRRRGYDVKATRTFDETQQNAVAVLKAVTPKSKLQTDYINSVMSVYKEPSGGPLHYIVKSDPELASSAFKLATPESQASKIMSALDRHPDGARGELTFSWLMGGGHSVAWEKIKGRPVVFDTQNGQVFKTSKELAKSISNSLDSASYLRLDNLPMNHEFLQGWVKNVD